MKIEDLSTWATDKDKFLSVPAFIDFARAFLEYRASTGFQAELVAQNTPEYRFFQYHEDASFQITRPINTNLYYQADSFDEALKAFHTVLESVNDASAPSTMERDAFTNVIYTCQQSIGAALDALPAGKSNRARKINGDLFERFIGLLIEACGFEARSGVVRIPVKDVDNRELFKMNYQHDVMIEIEGELKAIGSVKTSSKDRIDKIFIDKFLYNKIAETDIPHFAIFLNDVQRKGRLPNYGTSRTFLSGKFKGYTIKLNALDGVYYCDLLPSMTDDPMLSEHISRIDNFFVDDLPEFIRQAQDIEVIDKSEDIIDATD